MNLNIANFFKFVNITTNIALSVAQSFAQTFIYNANLFTDTSDNAYYNQIHWLIRTPHFSIIGSNESQKVTS